MDKIHIINRSAEQRLNDLSEILNNKRIPAPTWINEGYGEKESMHESNENPSKAQPEKPPPPPPPVSKESGSSKSIMESHRTARENEATKSSFFRPPIKAPAANRDMGNSRNSLRGFCTAREEAAFRNMKKHGKMSDFCTTTSTTTTTAASNENLPAQVRPIGMRRTVTSKFVSPVQTENPRPEVSKRSTCETSPPDERLAGLNSVMVQQIENEMLEKSLNIDWNDIVGLDYAKKIIHETVVCPLLRPDIFSGKRMPPKAILLFGPPGTGKTLIGKCIASQSGSTFFNISSSSLTSKFVGESEKMVRTLFAVAAVHQPSVIFVDEIDALLSKRNENDHESSRRLKNEFFVQMEGAATSSEDRIVVVGATNRPQELDDAARRRFGRRLYIPLPDQKARSSFLKQQLTDIHHEVTEAQLEEIGALSEGYSCSDLKTVCFDAFMEPIRSIDHAEFLRIDVNNLPPVIMEHIVSALDTIKPSVAKADIEQYIEWDKAFGSNNSRTKSSSLK